MGAADPAAGLLAGEFVDVSAVGSCGGLADVALGNLQSMIDAVDALDPTQLAALGANDLIPGIERYLKRERLIVVRLFELGCSTSDLNVLIAEGTPDLTAQTSQGSMFLEFIEGSPYFFE